MCSYTDLLRYAGFKSEEDAAAERNKFEGIDFKSIISSPISTEADLIRIIHMVYAWMPTMLRSFSKVEGINAINLQDLLRYSQMARKKDITDDQERKLFTGLAKLTKNHMVGASKVLMVLNNEVYPIFDNRVMVGWNEYPENKNRKLSNKSIIKDENDCLKNYIMYKNCLITWAKQENKTIRQFEFLFFYKGRQMQKEFEK